MATKEKSLDELLKEINNSFGKDSIYEYGNFEGDKTIQRIKTGSIGLDYITGGGWARGLMNYIVGFESSGKSTACLLAMASAQRDGGVVAYIDHEYSFDSTYAKALGVDVDKLIVSQPDTMEDGYEIFLKLASSGKFSVIAFDSIAASIPRKEAEGDVGDANIALRARINSTTLPKICRELKKSNTAGLFVNQFREKPGVMYGSPITEPGGNALKFYPSIKVEMKKSQKSEEDGYVIGNLVKVTCTKNKTSAPFRKTEFDIIYGEGVSKEGEILDFAAELGIVTKSGAWYSYEGTNIGQGRAKTILMLKDNEELLLTIENEVRNQLGI